jgi:hypothetical protein
MTVQGYEDRFAAPFGRRTRAGHDANMPSCGIGPLRDKGIHDAATVEARS